MSNQPRLFQPRLLLRLAESWPLDCWSEDRLVIAVSGGADSVALLRALQSFASDPRRLQVAHFNHGWRGLESDQDEQFVVELCRLLELRCSVGKNEETAGVRSEQAARKARYRYLRQVARQHSARFIVTAHTASDRVETMLHNLCRGTGLAGVCTPTIYRDLDDQTTLVRPMIGCFREEVLEYLQVISQEFRDDSSNQNQSYRRNFLRQSILPLLRQVYGEAVDERLLSYSQLAEQSLNVQLDLAGQYWSQAQQVDRESVALGWLPAGLPQQLRFPCATLLPAAWPIVLLALQQAWHANAWKQQSLTRRHWLRLRRSWEEIQPPPKLRPRKPRSLLQLPGNIQVSSLNGWLIMSAEVAGDFSPSIG